MNPKDGDACNNHGENFIFFRGQWRRRSELEAYASAAKHLTDPAPGLRSRRSRYVERDKKLDATTTDY